MKNVAAARRHGVRIRRAEKGENGTGDGRFLSSAYSGAALHHGILALTSSSLMEPLSSLSPSSLTFMCGQACVMTEEDKKVEGKEEEYVTCVCNEKGRNDICDENWWYLWKMTELSWHGKGGIVKKDSRRRR